MECRVAELEAVTALYLVAVNEIIVIVEVTVVVIMMSAILCP